MFDRNRAIKVYCVIVDNLHRVSIDFLAVLEKLKRPFKYLI